MELIRPWPTSLLGLAASGMMTVAAAVIGPALQAAASGPPVRVCAFDPTRGLPNPLGMRAYITITEAEGNTTFLFEQFPVVVSHDDQVEVEATLALTRQLVFYGTALEQARQIMLRHPGYYAELVGYSDGEGFAPLNRVLTCRSNPQSGPYPWGQGLGSIRSLPWAPSR